MKWTVIILVSVCLWCVASAFTDGIGSHLPLVGAEEQEGLHRVQRGALSCPPIRKICLSDRTFRPPTICQTDDECRTEEKCCPDACLKDMTICKPGV